jgi:hypothetical protein
MKSVLFLLAVAVILISDPLFGQEPPVTYLGLYADGARTTWCACGDPEYQIDMWVYAIPGQGGLKAYNFDLSYPSNVVVMNLALNRHRSTPITCLPGYCDPPPGLYGEFDFCLEPPKFWDVLWLVHGTLNVISSEPGIVELVPTAGSGEKAVTPYPPTFQVTRCDGVNESPPVLTKLYVNYGPSTPECSGMAVNQKTWGAIKHLYR